MTLSEAITAVETTQTGLAQADGVLKSAEEKLAAASEAQKNAAASDQAAVEGANAALDALIQVATAAKR